MKLPNAERAIIAKEKLRDYLLSHESGTGKSAFFERLGYTDANWEALESDLRSQILPADAQEVRPSHYGRKFVITDTLTGPLGVAARIVSVWAIRHGEDVPRLVTVYPARKA